MQAFGDHLRRWRTLRRMSQLDLALEAGVSSRHLSFLETGRAGPSRGMILQLADALAVPRAERNLMLTAAGHAPVYTARALDDPELAPVARAVRRLIERHDPYPALVMDRLWTITALNDGGARLFGAVGLGVGASLLDAMAGPARAAIVNWAEVGHHALMRLRAESLAGGGIAELDRAAEALAADPEIAAFTPATPLPAMVPTVFSLGETTLSFASVFAQFGSAEDIALSELKIELMFPADAATEAALGA